MERNRDVLDRAADRVMDLDSPAWGDERERAVFMESSSFGLTTGLYAGHLGAVIASLFGLVLLPVTLLLLANLPAVATIWYAKRRNVDLQKLAEDAGARSTMLNALFFGIAMVVTCAALAYTVFTGHSVLPTPSLAAAWDVGFFRGLAQGAVVGGTLGALAAMVGAVLSYRRASRQRRAGNR